MQNSHVKGAVAKLIPMKRELKYSASASVAKNPIPLKARRRQ